jgi:PHD/YefM family antitoxin component YafN of YafNO toxin-antitoxin module
MISPEYIIDQRAKKKAVVVPMAEWQRLMDELEELEDIRAYDKTKARPERVMPFEDAVREIRSKKRK